MLRSRLDSTAWSPSVAATPIIAGLFVGCTVFNIVANASFKVAAQSPGWRGFLTWQVIGNLAGFITVLTLTGLLRYIPLGVAFPVTTGLAVIGVQVAAAALIFHEPISSIQWLGTAIIIVGILLVGHR